MKNSKTANLIKTHYIEKPIKLIETEWNKQNHIGSQFIVNTRIWVDQHLPEYRIAIPSSNQWDGNFENIEDLSSPIETRFITYIPTGRVVYDNTRLHPEAIVYEYILEQMLGKKDLTHK